MTTNNLLNYFQYFATNIVTVNTGLMKRAYPRWRRYVIYCQVVWRTGLQAIPSQHTVAIEDSVSAQLSSSRSLLSREMCLRRQGMFFSSLFKKTISRIFLSNLHAIGLNSIHRRLQRILRALSNRHKQRSSHVSALCGEESSRCLLRFISLLMLALSQTYHDRYNALRTLQ